MTNVRRGKPKPDDIIHFLRLEERGQKMKKRAPPDGLSISGPQAVGSSGEVRVPGEHATVRFAGVGVAREDGELAGQQGGPSWLQSAEHTV